MGEELKIENETKTIEKKQDNLEPVRKMIENLEELLLKIEEDNESAKQKIKDTLENMKAYYAERKKELEQEEE